MLLRISYLNEGRKLTLKPIKVDFNLRSDLKVFLVDQIGEKIADFYVQTLTRAPEQDPLFLESDHNIIKINNRGMFVGNYPWS